MPPKLETDLPVHTQITIKQSKNFAKRSVGINAHLSMQWFVQVSITLVKESIQIFTKMPICKEIYKLIIVLECYILECYI